MAEPGSPTAGIATVFSRRSHRKSRNGCKTCKERHLKCDETKPQCLNCLNHAVHCVYAFSTSSLQRVDPTPRRKKASRSSEKPSPRVQFVELEYQHVFSTSSASTNPERMPKGNPSITPAFSPLPATDPQFCLEDFELYHFFLTSTCITLAEDEASRDFWSYVVPRVGYRYLLVHHLMLSLTCLHMSRTDGNRQSSCSSRFDYHYSTGIRLLSACIAEAITDNTEPMWIGSVLICFISMARGPREGNFLFFGVEGPVEFISLLQGTDLISSMTQKGRSPNEQGGLEKQNSPVPVRVNCLYREHIHKLSCFTEERAARDPLLHRYRFAVDSILQLFNSIFYDGTNENADTPIKPEPFVFILFTWVTQMGKDFWDALQQKEVVPLVIMAHFVVIIYRMDRTWFSNGWPEHVLHGIKGFLGKEDHGMIEWPMDQVVKSYE